MSEFESSQTPEELYQQVENAVFTGRVVLEYFDSYGRLVQLDITPRIFSGPEIHPIIHDIIEQHLY